MYEIIKWLGKYFCTASTRLPATVQSPTWSLFKFIGDDGSFDYAKYRQSQVAANKKKIDSVWVQEANILFLSNYLRQQIPMPQFGICHGTRRGLEQQWFRKYLGCEVIGTEISDTALDFPHTIQWDFHEVRPEWLGTTDFIYSNSLDHSYDPEKCLNAWVSCLKPNGVLVIEHSSDDIDARETDPFGAHLQIMPFLFLQWAKGNYSTREIIKAPSNPKTGNREHSTFFLVIKRN